MQRTTTPMVLVLWLCACSGAEFRALEQAIELEPDAAAPVVASGGASSEGGASSPSRGGAAGESSSAGAAANDSGSADAGESSSSDAGSTEPPSCDVPESESWGLSVSSTCQIECAHLPGAPYLPEKAIDGDPTTRWTTRAPQNSGSGTPDDWFRVDFGRVVEFSRIVIDTTPSPDDAPGMLVVSVADAPDEERRELYSGPGETVLDLGGFTASGRFLWLEQSGGDGVHHWSIYELEVHCGD